VLAALAAAQAASLRQARREAILVRRAPVQAHLHVMHALEAVVVFVLQQVLHEVGRQHRRAVPGGARQRQPHAPLQHALHELFGAAATQALAAVHLDFERLGEAARLVAEAQPAVVPSALPALLRDIYGLVQLLEDLGVFLRRGAVVHQALQQPGVRRRGLQRALPGVYALNQLQHPGHGVAR